MVLVQVFDYKGFIVFDFIVFDYKGSQPRFLMPPVVLVGLSGTDTRNATQAATGDLAQYAKLQHVLSVHLRNP